MIEEYLDVRALAAAARFYGCSVFELMEREDRETWMTAWERMVGAEARLAEAREETADD